ncbi:hypothetical protein DM01DRAFT_241473, partial [Hesseltinella vesiculosa]
IINPFATLIQKLSDSKVDNQCMEQELIFRFLDPALAPILNNHSQNMYFRWTATKNEEAK